MPYKKFAEIRSAFSRKWHFAIFGNLLEFPELKLLGESQFSKYDFVRFISKINKKKGGGVLSIIHG